MGADYIKTSEYIKTLKDVKSLKRIDAKFIKFLAVGGLNTLFGYSVFALFIFLKFHYSIASFLSTIAGILFNFKTTGKLVFNNDNNKLLYKFVAVYGVVYLVNVTFLKIFKAFNVSMFVAGAILLFPQAVLSFYLNNKYVFKE